MDSLEPVRSGSKWIFGPIAELATLCPAGKVYPPGKTNSYPATGKDFLI
jgi:hypothetical protein